MIIRKTFKEKIAALPEGVVVSARDFGAPRANYATIVKALNQYEAAGILVRMSKGRYYKPRTTSFGIMPPSETEIVKDFLVKDGKTIGYITGTRAFARLALTTQVPAAITVGTNIARRPLTRGQYKISFLLQPNRIAKRDIPLLILLDALRQIKTIPATTADATIAQMIVWIRALPARDQQRLITLGKAYKPYVRAQVGAIYEYLGLAVDDLQDTLNPTTRYPLAISRTTLPTVAKWNIV